MCLTSQKSPVIVLSDIVELASFSFFLVNDASTSDTYTLSLHDALPILRRPNQLRSRHAHRRVHRGRMDAARGRPSDRSEEHTSELQSRFEIVCRLLLEKKKSHSMP